MANLTSKEFSKRVAELVGLAPGTVRTYLSLAGFMPVRKESNGRWIANVWDDGQVNAAARAIEGFRAGKATMRRLP